MIISTIYFIYEFLFTINFDEILKRQMLQEKKNDEV